MLSTNLRVQLGAGAVVRGFRGPVFIGVCLISLPSINAATRPSLVVISSRDLAANPDHLARLLESAWSAPVSHASATNQSPTVSGQLAGPTMWSRLHVPDPVAGRAAREALNRAWEWLARPRCRTLLTDFSDPTGRPLADRLAGLGIDIQTYLTWVVFIDDTHHPACVTGVLAVMVPGSRVVRLCTTEIKRARQQDSPQIVAAFIHEMLHTLGLAENPPSSNEITKRVLARCRQ
jgi:hypothetical protein